MQTKKEGKQENTGKAKSQDKKKGSKAVHLDATPATGKVKPKAGGTLHNEGTNVSYDEQS